MKKSLVPMREVALLLIWEIIFAAVVSGVYLLLNKFSYRVVLGSLLGITVTVVNFIILSIMVGRAFDKALAARGTSELSEEEIEAFTREQNQAVQAATKKSFLIRTVLMLFLFIGAFLWGHFDVIATLIPPLLFRPIITVDALIQERKSQKKEES
jgi:predicted histidine transporter YuiF (NhaC family)